MSDVTSRLNRSLDGRYRVERELGEGGMATVYLAHDVRHDRPVALKVMHPDMVTADAGERFLHEIRVTARLNHPRILALLDSGEVDGLLYYVMPLVEGESLRDRLEREGPLPLEEALGIAADVADALEAAHRSGVFHRDVKPANILLSAGHAILADFGVAKGIRDVHADGLTRTGTSIGTPTYMSPEQAAGDSRVDARSDVYALGCVLYEMLAGEPPFTGASPVAVFAKKASERAPDVGVLRPTVPEGVRQVLRRSLERVPADRQASAAELRDALLSPPEVAPAAVPRLSRATLGRAAALVVGAAVGAGAIYYGLGRGGATDPGQLSVLVWPLENGSGDPGLDGLGITVADRIVDRAQAAGLGTMIPATSLVGGGGGARGVAPGEVRRHAEAVDADLVVLGRYYLEGDSLRVAVRLTGPDATTPRRPLPLVSLPAGDLADASEATSSRVMGALALENADPDLYLVADEGNGGRPPLWESLQVYREALATFEAGGARQAEELLRRAMELDPLFGSPALTLAQNAPGGAGARRSITEHLNRNREILGPRGLLRLDWVRAFNGADWEALRAAGLRIADGATNNDDWYHVGVGALVQGRYREAREAFENVDPTSGVNLGWYRLMPETLHLLGDYEGELAFVRANPVPGTERHEIEAFAAMGDREAVDSILDDLTRARPAFIANQRRAMSQELAAHGYAEEARAMMDQALAELQSSGEFDDPANADLYGRVLGYAGRWEEAQRHWEDVYERMRSGPIQLSACAPECSVEYVQWYRAQAAAHLGQADRALSLSRDMPPFSRARINAALGRREVAVALLKQAFEEGRGMDFYDHINPDFASLRGYPPYEEFVQPVE